MTTEQLQERIPQAGSILEGRYELLGQLGEGGVGWVFKAKHLKLGHHVAIKMLQTQFVSHEQMRPRFEREAKALAALTHPHVVTLTDYSLSDGRPYLVMELLEGATLAELLEKGPIPEARARNIVRQVLEALVHAHQRGFVHRDLKPGNVFLVALPTLQDFVKVLDFGFVKLIDPDHEKSRGSLLTRSGLAFGTPSYMSPEQASGGETDQPTDMYSLGIMFYEMLAGERPFRGEITDIIRQHLTADLPPLRVGKLEPTPALRAFLERATAKSPKSRFASAAEMLEELDKLPNPMLREARLAPPEAPTLAEGSKTPDGWPAAGAPLPVAPAPTRASRRRYGPLLFAVGVFLALGIFVVAGSARLAVLRDRLEELPGLAARPPGGADREPGSNDPAAPAHRRTEGPGTIAAEPEAENQDPPGVVMEQVGTTQPGVPEQVVMIEDAPPPEIVAETVAPTPPAVVDAGVEAEAEAADTEVPEEAEAEAEAPAPGLGPNPWVRRGRVTLLVNANRQLVRGRPLSRSMVSALQRYARNNRGDPRPHLALGASYYLRHYETDAVERYLLAQNFAPDARNDPRMLRHLVRLAANGDATTQAAEAVARIYGALAKAQVESEVARPGYDEAAIARLQRLARRLR